MVFAPHWYDLRVLFEKAHGEFSVNVQAISRGVNPLKTFHWGHRGARDNFATQIRTLVEAGYRSLGERPVLISECGVPMDMNGRMAFKTDDWKWQRRMMDAMITAFERANVGFTLWNYNPENDDSRGDDWNGENFSWFSNLRASHRSTTSGQTLVLAQDAKELDLGGRILDAVVRPYAAKTAGVPLKSEYEMTTGTFSYSWTVPPQLPPLSTSEATSTSASVRQPSSNVNNSGSLSVHTPPLTGHPPLLARETEIFIPEQLARGRRLIVEGLREGDTYTYDVGRQTLFVLPGAQTQLGGEQGYVQAHVVHNVTVRFDPPLRGEIPNDFWTDFAAPVTAVLVVLLALIAYFS